MGATGLKGTCHHTAAALPGYVAGLSGLWAFLVGSLMRGDHRELPRPGCGLGQLLENARTNSDMAIGLRGNPS